MKVFNNKFNKYLLKVQIILPESLTNIEGN